MKKIVKRIIPLLCLIIALLITITSSEILSVAVNDEEKGVKQSEGTPLKYMENYNATDVEKTALEAGFKPVLNSSDLTLWYKEETAEIAVYNAKNKEMVYSNPQNIPETVKGVPLHKIKSQLYLTYYQENNQIKFYSSSYDALGRDQVTADIVNDTLRVNYVFGKKKITKEMLPIAIPKDKFEEKVLPKLSDEDSLTIRKQYKLVSSKDQMSEKTRKRYETEYKNFTSTDIYILNKYIANFDIEPIYDILYSTDYTQTDFREDNKDAGVEKEVVDENVIFELALVYSLEDGDLQVELDCSKLKKLDNANIHTIDILQFFGASSSSENGYFLIPSGSGGLVKFNSTKSTAGAYSEFVYGADSTIKVNNLNNNNIKINLPVLGISNTTKNNGMLITAEEAAEYLKVNADIGDGVIPYNYAYFSAVVFPFDEMTVNNPISGGGTTQVYTHQKEIFKGKVKLSYNFLEKDKNTYSDMANLYREKLVKDGVLKDRVSGEQPFVYGLLGGIDVKKHFLGIPYTGMQSITTFEQAEEIIGDLKKEGINNQYVKYLDWFNGGAKQTIPDTVDVLSCLGGKKDLDKLVKNKNAKIYPNVSFTKVNNGLFDSFSVRKDTARLTYNEPALIYNLSIPKNFFDYNSKYSYIVSPNIYNETVTKFAKEFNYNNLSVGDFANTVNSDFNESKYVDRVKSLKLTVEAIEKLAKDNDSIMASAPNKYAAKYVDIFTDMPITSSNANIIETHVPFQQMVYSGYKDMVSEPINMSTGDYSLAKLLSFAISPSFTFGYEESSIIMNTDYTEYYSFCFNDWKKDAVETYKTYKEATKNVRGKSIISHNVLENGICELKYEGGSVFYINDTDKDISLGDKVIKAKSYVYEEG